MATDSSTFRRLVVFVPLGILLLGVQLLFAGSRANAALSNRFSFTTDASDSVAQQDGLLVGTNGSVAGGQLVLANQGEFSADPGAAGAYLDLPNGLISNAAAAGTTGAVTIEMWVTMDTNRDWAAAFTAGTNLGGEDAASGGVDSPYIQIIPRSGDGGLGNDLRVTSNAFASEEGFVDDATDLAIGVREHLVAVFDQSSGLPGAVTVYRNGVLVPAPPGVGRGGVLADNLDLTAFLNADTSGGDVNVWLGRSQFNDPLATARYDELRVYSHALTIDEAIAGTILGPDVVGETSVVSVEVNRTTGGISLRNNTASAVSLEYYKLASSGGGLLPEAWESLDAQNYNAVDGPDGGELADDSDGEGWDASASSSATQLIELFLGSGGSILEPQASLDLGLAYDADLFGAANGDLVFEFGIANGGLFAGPVAYVDSMPLVGDYDGSGVVDLADYTLWRDSLGQTGTDLLADGNTNNTIDIDDYLLWSEHFNQQMPAAVVAQNPVPEPATLRLLAVAGVALGWAGRRRNRSGRPTAASATRSRSFAVRQLFPHGLSFQEGSCKQ